MQKVSLCVCVCVCVCARACVRVCARVRVHSYIFGLFYQSIFAVNSFTPHNILWALFLCSSSVVSYFHILTMFLVFLCFLLTKKPGKLAPVPKRHPATPTSKSGYVDDRAIRKQPIQTEETAI